ncbi:MAG: arginine--tRNA ligase [Acidimicrobiales bacterium]|nr:arginine--tRNA ligase [Acidimicrobiales bacterium]
MRDTLAAAVRQAIVDQGIVPPATIHLERPARLEHGDWSSNVALTLAKGVGRKPRELAEELKGRLESRPPPHLMRIEVAGPGFLNFHLRDSWLHEALRQVVEEGTKGYGRSDLGQGERVQIEFVSANPTGPLHVGNGWFASYGDALARVMERCGYRVHREYYVNDTGGQIRQLGKSLLARRRGEAPPEEGYQGAYVADLAATYEGPDEAGPGREPRPEDVDEAGRFAVEQILAQIKATLARLEIVFDEWVSQATFETGAAVEETLDLLRRRGVVFEQDGAVWLRSTELGDSRDRPLRRSAERGGDYTYLAGDLAYHRDKFLVRGFDRVIDVLGADHHGQVASLQAGIEALGVDPSRLEVKLGQLVSVVGRDGNGERMSKRAGNFVSLDQLVDEVGGPGATRLLSLVSSIDHATTLDLEVVRRQSAENPVYYVQYAHARIASIEKVRVERGIERRPIDEVDLSVLTHQRELDLLRGLTELPEMVELACRDRAPHKVTTWVRDLAGRFHAFYHDCYVIGDVPPELTQARLWLVEATRVGLAVGLDLLGVEAPEAM